MNSVSLKSFRLLYPNMMVELEVQVSLAVEGRPMSMSAWHTVADAELQGLVEGEGYWGEAELVKYLQGLYPGFEVVIDQTSQLQPIQTIKPETEL